MVCEFWRSYRCGDKYFFGSGAEGMFVPWKTRRPVQKRAIVGEGVGGIVAHIIGVKFAFPVEKVLGESVKVFEDLILRIA